MKIVLDENLVLCTVPGTEHMKEPKKEYNPTYVRILKEILEKEAGMEVVMVGAQTRKPYNKVTYKIPKYGDLLREIITTTDGVKTGIKENLLQRTRQGPSILLKIKETCDWHLIDSKGCAKIRTLINNPDEALKKYNILDIAKEALNDLKTRGKIYKDEYDIMMGELKELEREIKRREKSLYKTLEKEYTETLDEEIDWLPKGVADETIREFAEKNEFIIISNDKGRELESSKTDRIYIDLVPLCNKPEEVAEEIINRINKIKSLLS